MVHCQVTILKWRCSPDPAQDPSPCLSFPHADLIFGATHEGLHPGPDLAVTPWLAWRAPCLPWPPTWPLHHHLASPPPLRLDTGLGAPVGPMQNPEVGGETGKKSREEVQVSLLGSILVLKSFKALILIGIPHQNMAIIVSIPNEV